VARILDRLPRGGRVAVVRLRSLGDCVLTTPALALLKRSRPDLHLAVVAEDRFAPVFTGNPNLDAVLPPALGPLRAFRPDLCLNLHGGPRSARLTLLSGARWRAGFGHFPLLFLYNVRIPRAQDILGEERVVHTAEHLASAMFFLGVRRCEIPRAQLAAPAAGRVSTAVFHAVANVEGKAWSKQGFLEVARHVRQQGLDPVFIGAASDDLSAFSEFRVLKGAPLDEIKQLLAGAALFVGNDSGPAHMAAAFGVPSVVLFGVSDPAIWGPWRTANVVLRAPKGLAAITVEEVVAAVDRLEAQA
jgi:heptosyltransferase III